MYTEMVWMYVNFGSKARPRTLGCVAMGSALMFIFRSRLHILREQSASCFVCI